MKITGRFQQRRIGQPDIALDAALADEAISYYQTASYLFSQGMLSASRADGALPR